jgi:dihydroxy-acid dehydratase
MSMDVEEMIRAQPMDAVILIGGCDKTVPALLMGAASANVPAIMLVTGPMLAGSWRGERVGACTDCRRFWARYRGGQLSEGEVNEVNGELAPTIGTCSVMGTASTMALATEAMGMMLPGGATAPAVYAERRRIAENTGTRAVQMAAERLTPRKIMTGAAIENALRITLAAGGSTNAVIHLTAIAGRLGIDVDLGKFDEMGRDVPVLIDMKPTGQHYLEDLHNAGGLPTVMRELGSLVDTSCLTVTGKSIADNLAVIPEAPWQDVVRPLSNPIFAGGSIAVLRGNIAPQSAIIKQGAATPALLQHTGPAMVFEDLADLSARIDSPDLDVTADSVLVLRNAGPRGAPGMPEAGYLPIPRKLAQAGVKDMVRISDARMSGTAFGTIVLHIGPESAIGGPLSLVRTGDLIALDVAARSINLLVDEPELSRRADELGHKAPAPQERGFARLHQENVLQAQHGCDFNFLRKHPLPVSAL